MLINKKDLLKIIREALDKEGFEPFDGMTGHMQSHNVPAHAQKDLSSTIAGVHKNGGGPLDAAYEIEKKREWRDMDLPNEFYQSAFEMMREGFVFDEDDLKSVQVTRNQLRTFLQELHGYREGVILTEAELNEISAMIARIGAGLGKLAGKLGPMMSKGIAGLKGSISKSPEIAKTVKGFISKAAPKMKSLKKYMDAVGMDIKNIDTDALVKMFDNPPDTIKADLDKVMKQAGKQLQKAEECNCPSLEDLKKMAAS